MKFGDEIPNTKSTAPMRRLGRIVFLILLIVGGIFLFQYRGTLSTRISKAFAAADEDPVPLTKLGKQAFLVTVPATGEVVGLETTAITTPNTSSGTLKLSWLIPEGSYVQQGDPVIRFDSTDAKLSLENQENTLEENQQRTQITTLKQSTDDKVLGMDRTTAEMDYEYAVTVMPQDETIFPSGTLLPPKRM